MTPPLILASSSAYKRMLLERLQLSFHCQPPETDEEQTAGESPEAMAQRLAEEKAMTVVKKNPNALVIGADQVGELKGQIVGKPGNFAQAVDQLSAQSGQSVKFHSAICVVQMSENGQITKKTRLNTTEVRFRVLSQQQIERYLHADRPYDCAGSFKSEGLGISLFSHIKSNDPSSLVGLPLIDLCSLLSEYGVKIPNLNN